MHVRDKQGSIWGKLQMTVNASESERALLKEVRKFSSHLTDICKERPRGLTEPKHAYILSLEEIVPNLSVAYTKTKLRADL